MRNRTRTQDPVALASKPRPNHPNHHLTNNNGRWWCQITVHEGMQSKRMRFSLKTGSLRKAREVRDRIFKSLSAQSIAD